MHSEEVSQTIPPLSGSTGMQASQLFVYWYILQFRNLAAVERTDRPRGGISTVPIDSDKYASLEEVRAALEQLLRNTPDLLRLEKIARLRARGLPTEGKDLLNEAFARVLEGRRQWPRKVPFLNFLCRVMQSIASEGIPDDRWKLPKEPEILEKIKRVFDGHKIPLEIIERIGRGCDSPHTIQKELRITKTEYSTALKRIKFVTKSIEWEIAEKENKNIPVSDPPSKIADGPPDEQHEAREIIKKVREEFRDDEIAIAIIDKRMEAGRDVPDEVKKELDITDTQYDSAIKRVRRKLRKLAKVIGYDSPHE